jgi:hypothetical protein
VPYKKLSILIAVALSIPMLGYAVNQYVYVSTFPFGAYYHSAITFGTLTFGLLLVAGSVGLLVGLVRPSLSLWVGERNRKRVLVVYGLTLALGITVKYETYFFSKLIFSNEEENVALVYRTLEPGASIRDVQQTIEKVDPNIRYHYADISRYSRTTGYPYDGTPRFAIEIKYPSFYPKLEVQSRIVTHLSANLTEPEAVVERIAFLRGDILRDLRPPARPEEVRVYRGFLLIDARTQTFTPCGQSQPLWLDSSPGQLEQLEKQHRNTVRGPSEKSFAILTGAIGPRPSCQRCDAYSASFKVMQVYEQRSEKSSRCEP